MLLLLARRRLANGPLILLRRPSLTKILAAYTRHRSLQGPRACPRYALGTSFLSHPEQGSGNGLLELPDRPPCPNFTDLIDMNATSPPDYGSVVEFYDPVTSEHRLGAVIQPACALFHPTHSMAVVLTLDNDLVRVSPVDMTFHAWQALDPHWLCSLEIWQHRFDNAHQGRHSVLTALKQFATESVRLSDALAPQLVRTHAQLAKTSRISPVLVMQIIDLVELMPRTLAAILNGYWAQCTLIYGLHVALTASPLYISSSMFRRPCNVIAHHSTNTCVSHNTYYTLSTINGAGFTRLLHTVGHPQLFQNLDTFMSHQLRHPHLSTDDASVYFTIWDGKPYKYVIQVIKAMIVFPHPAIMAALHRLTVFADHPHLKPQHLYDFLVSIGVYAASESIPNPLLSANIVGEPSAPALQVSSYAQIKAVDWPVTYPRDHFAHLRRRKYYRDHTIYGINDIGLSLEKINARKFRINIHVPCFALHIPPAGALFTHLASDGMFDAMIDDTADPALPELPRLDQFRLSDPTYKLCLTFSFEYLTFDNNPFVNADSKVDVSLDDISGVVFKQLSDDQIEQCIAGEKPVLAFSLFRASAQRLNSSRDTDHEIGADDMRAFGFVYGCLKTHFRARFARNALELAPQLNDPGDSTAKLVFESELAKFTSMLAGVYCSTHRIPVLARSQVAARVETKHTNDAAWVAHENPLVPDFQTRLLDQTLIARGPDGYASHSAYYVSRHFMHREQYTIGGPGHATYGLEHGYVHVALPLYESMLNQLQILSHLQAQASKSCESRMQVATGYGFLKRAGYNVNGAYDRETICAERSKISAAQETVDFLTTKSRRYRILRQIEHALAHGLEQEYECVVVHVGSALGTDMSELRAYCIELDMEVTVCHHGSVGSALRCKVLYVDVIGEELVMQVCSH